MDLVDEIRPRTGPENPLDLGGHFRGSERLELQPLDSLQPADLGQPVHERMTAIQLVAAIRRDEEYPAAARASSQECDQVQ